MKKILLILTLLSLVFVNNAYCPDIPPSRAKNIRTDTSAFNNNLSSTDDNAQDAFDTIDNLSLTPESTTVSDTTTINLTLTGSNITADGLYTAGDDLTLTGADFDVDSTVTRDTEWDSLSEINTASTDADILIFQNLAVTGQTTVATDAVGDTLTLAGGGITAITTNATSDTITFTSTEVDGSTTNEINTITLPDANVTAGLGITFAQSGSIAITESAADTVLFTVTETQTLSGLGGLPLTGGTLSGALTINDNDGVDGEVMLTVGDADDLDNLKVHGDVDITGDLIVTDITSAVGPVTITGATPLIFEGATANDFETSFAITDPTTPDKVITVPDATGTVAITASSPITLNSTTGNLTISQATTSADGYVIQADWDSWTDHVADNTQAHSDYLLNSGADTMLGNLTITATDSSIILDETAATDTDFWISNTSDSDGVDDDKFQIGDGVTPGTNPFLTIDIGGNVGIGTTGPDELTHIASATTLKPVLKIENTTSDTTSGAILFTKNDAAANASGDDLGEIRVAGFDTAESELDAIKFEADAAWGSAADTTDTPTRITFWTVPDGSETEAEQMRIASTGLVTLTDDLTVTGGDITLATSAIFSGGDTTSLNLIDAIDATTETTLEAAIDTLGSFAEGGLADSTVVSADIKANTITNDDITLTLDMGGATSLEVPNGANPTTDAAGEIAIDSSAAPGSGIRIYGDAAYTIAGTYSKSFVILLPVATDDYPVWSTPYAITITHVHVQCLGGTNIVGQLTECDGEGINPAVVDSADITATANNSVDDDGTLSNPSIDAGDYVGWATTSISGTPTSVTVTFDYTINQVN